MPQDSLTKWSTSGSLLLGAETTPHGSLQGFPWLRKCPRDIVAGLLLEQVIQETKDEATVSFMA